MQVLHPWMLFGLILVPVAVLLHVFRAPGRRHSVSSLKLWRGALDEVRSEAAERVRRFDWLLFLEVLVVALLVLALAWPVIWVQRPRHNVGIITDESASMGTLGSNGHTRREMAQESVRQVEVQLTPHDLVTRCSSQAGVSLLPDRLLADGLASLGSEPQAIFLVTDKPPAKIDDPRVRVVAVGGPSQNAGIVAFSGDPNADGTLSIFLRVVNYAPAEQLRRLAVTNADKEIASDTLRLPPNGAIEERVFRVRLAAGDPVVRVKLEGDDGFATDDEVAGVVRPLKVCTAGETDVDPVYKRLFGGAVFEGTEYHPRGRPYSATFPDDSLIILDGVRRNAAGAAMVLLNPTTGEIAGIRIDPERAVTNPAARLTVGEDALTRSVDLSGVRLEKYRPLTIYGSGRALMRLDGIVVAAAGEENGHKVVVLGFDPARAGWTLQPSFVVFWANVLAEAKKAAGAGGLVFHRAGDAVRLPIGSKTGSIEGPDGREDLLPDRSGWCAYQPKHVGVYHWQGGGVSGVFAANLLSEVESDNRPSPLVATPPSFDLPAPLAGRSIPLAPWLALAAGILAILWWQFRK